MIPVIFDMDGTLLRLDVDIEEVRLRLAALFAPYGVTRPFRPILRRITEASREAAAAGGDAEDLRRRGLAILDEWEVKGGEIARARPFAVEIVRKLAAAGTPLAIVTDNGRACVAPALRAAGYDPAWFRAIVTRDDVAAPKPDPSGVLKAVAAVGTPAAYVGDHPKDVEAGRAAAVACAGLRVIGVKGGYASDGELARAGADAVLDTMDSLLADLAGTG